MKRLAAATVLVIIPLTFEPRAAFAEQVETERAETERVWYGWKVIIPTVAARLIGVAALAARDDEKALVGLSIASYAVYVVGSPVAHATEGEWTHALGGFAVRLLVPAAGGAIGFAVGDAADSGCSWICVGRYVGLMIGAGVGYVTAALVDIIALGFTDVPVEEDDGWAVAPLVQVDSERTQVGLALRW